MGWMARQLAHMWQMTWRLPTRQPRGLSQGAWRGRPPCRHQCSQTRLMELMARMSGWALAKTAHAGIFLRSHSFLSQLCAL